jgi:hypothetical protein
LYSKTNTLFDYVFIWSASEDEVPYMRDLTNRKHDLATHLDQTPKSNAAFADLVAAAEAQLTELLRHGYGTVRITCRIGNAGVRDVMIEAGRAFRFRITASAQNWQALTTAKLQGGAIAQLWTPDPAMREIAEAVEARLAEIVRHGHGELVVRCDVGQHAVRKVSIQAGTSDQYTMPQAT